MTLTWMGYIRMYWQEKYLQRFDGNAYMKHFHAKPSCSTDYMQSV